MGGRPGGASRRKRPALLGLRIGGYKIRRLQASARLTSRARVTAESGLYQIGGFRSMACLSAPGAYPPPMKFRSSLPAAPRPWADLDARLADLRRQPMSRETWAELRRGLQESAAGQTVSLGSFASHAKPSARKGK